MKGGLGGAGKAIANQDGNKNNSEMPCCLKIPYTLEPIPPALCKKNVFHFFHSSVSG